MAVGQAWPSLLAKPVWRPTVDDLVRYLLDGVSVQLVGLPGSGRTTLARQTVEALALASVETVWLKGIQPLSDRPLTALSLAGVAVAANAHTNTASVAQAVDALATMIARKNAAALVIDDAEHLDSCSGGVILAARSRQAFPILFVDRPGRDDDPLVSTFVAESLPGVRVAIGALSLEEIDCLVHDLLGGVVDPAAVARIASLSGGLPLLVHALVDVARRTGKLREERGLWRLSGELWDDRLVQVIRPLIAGLSRDELATLGTLATKAGDGGPAPTKLAGLERLWEAGLLRVHGAPGRRTVTVFPGLLSDYLARSAGVEGLADVLGPRPEPPAASLPNGADASDFEVRLRATLAERVAGLRSAWEAEPDPEHAAPLLAALHAAAAGATDVGEVVKHTERPDDQAQASAELAAWAAVYRALAEDDTSGAIADLQAQEALLPGCEGYLRGFENHLEFLQQHNPTLAQAPEHETVDAVRIEALLAAGRTHAAREALRASSPHDPLVASYQKVCQGLARVLGGDLAGGVEWSIAELERAIEAFDHGRIDQHAYTVALGMVLHGALDELEAVFDLVFRLPDATMLAHHWRTGLLGLASSVRCWEGRHEHAARLDAQIAALHAGDGPFPWMQETREPSVTTGAEALWDTVDDRLSKGYLTAAAFLAVSAVEHSVDTARVDRLLKHGADTDSVVVQALLGYVSAMAARDAPGLRRVAEHLRTVCGPVLRSAPGCPRRCCCASGATSAPPSS